MNLGKGYKNAQWNGDYGFTFSDPRTTEREILTSDLYELIRKSYYLHRNNAICASISRVMVEYVGATGNVIDVPEYQDQEDFLNNWGKNCTVRGDNWERFRRQRITELTEGGGCLILFTQNPDRKKGEVGLKLEVLQGGRVCTPPDRVDGQPKNGLTSYSGIAYNSYGSEVGYWYKEGDEYPYIEKYNSLGMLNAYFERSPDAEKPTSGRTLPLITPVMTQIEAVSRLERNMSNWAEKVSIQGFMLETSDPQSVMRGLGMVNDDGSYKTEDVLNQTEIKGDVLPNMVGLVPSGFKAHILSPEGSADFSPIFEKFQKTISSGVGLVSTILFSDTAGKNFAVSKFEAQTFIRKIENWAKSLNYLDNLICVQVWQEANLRKLATFDVNANIAFGGSADFEGVDPSKSADAATKRISNGTTTKSFEASKQGRDFGNNIKTTIKEMDLVAELGDKSPNKWTSAQVFAYMGVQNVGVSVSTTSDDDDKDDKDDKKANEVDNEDD